MKKCEFCHESYGENVGVWKIVVFRKYRKIYRKKYSPLCHDCLIDAIGGYCTSGGLTGNVIKKIKRVKK